MYLRHKNGEYNTPNGVGCISPALSGGNIYAYAKPEAHLDRKLSQGSIYNERNQKASPQG